MHTRVLWMLALMACQPFPELDFPDNPTTDFDADGFSEDDGDCDDEDAAVFPFADELCDGKDNDCDNNADEDAVDAPQWFQDVDDDGYGINIAPVHACEMPDGYAPLWDDCDDTEAGVNPGAQEVCDSEGVDEDCDELVNDDDSTVAETLVWGLDSDDDGYGDALNSVEACEPPEGFVAGDADCDDADPDLHPLTIWYLDVDSDDYGISSSTLQQCDAPAGYVLADGDCDDADNEVFPSADELCDAKDNDCDDDVDEYPTDAPTWFLDADGDEVGVASTTFAACGLPNGYAAISGDCDDSDPDTHPGASEVCGGGDEDCNDLVDDDDDGVTGTLTWYFDDDDDGYGDPLAAVEACEAPLGFVAEDTDCNDNDAELQPNTVWYVDADDDGYGVSSSTVQQCDAPEGYVRVLGDCDDSLSARNPGHTEVCDGIDNNCNSAIDAYDVSVDPAEAHWFRDADHDLFGNLAQKVITCSHPTGYVHDSTDCSDADPDVNPDGIEVCDGIDNDCSGAWDDSDPGVVDQAIWYLDEDGDDVGVTELYAIACQQPEGFVAEEGDCDDEDPEIFPGHAEVCNEIDDDCNGATDDEDADVDAPVWYSDGDEDGYGDPADVVVTCEVLADRILEGGDCIDSSADVNPGVAEVCNDGVDNNCSGVDDCRLQGVVLLGDADGIATVSYNTNGSSGFAANVGFLGDLDGDGFDEIGTRTFQNFQTARTLIYGPFEGEYDSPTDLPRAFESATDLSPLGDLNTDGHLDLLASGGSVLYGPITGDPDNIVPSQLGILWRLSSGTYPSPMADINGDGHPEMYYQTGISCAMQECTTPALFIFYGGPTSPVFAGDVSEQDADLVIDIDAATVIVVDLDADGTGEILVGSPSDSTSGNARGAVYAFDGSTGGSLNKSDAILSIFGDVNNAQLGYGLSALGDVNADGYDDFVVTDAERYDPTCPVGTPNRGGQTYLFYGSASIQGGAATAAAGAVIAGSCNGPSIMTPAPIGDLDGDGFDDFVVGHSQATWLGLANAGVVYGFYGPATSATSYDDADFIIGGESGGIYGGLQTSATSGDANGDGLSDLLLGSSISFYGTAYLFNGRAQ